MIRKWIEQRLTERTTYDGAILIAAGVTFLVLKPIAHIVAYGAIGYGLYTMWKKG